MVGRPALMEDTINLALKNIQASFVRHIASLSGVLLLPWGLWHLFSWCWLELLRQGQARVVGGSPSSLT